MKTYTIQKWLFDEAEGKFEVDLAESGIQHHYLKDLNLDKNYDLNYSLDRGKLDLRMTLANMYNIKIDQVAITNGSQEGLYLFYRSFLSPDDHVITFTPGWQQSWEVPHAIGAEVTKIKLRHENSYQLNLDEIKQTIKNNTKLIILNNPNNPTGVKYSQTDLIQLSQLCEKNNIFLLCDEEYFINYPESLIHQGQNIGIVSSLSKVYGFPGLRLGWFLGPAHIVEKIVNYKRYVTVSNSSLCEYLGLQVLSNYKYYLKEYNDLINARYTLLKNWADKQADTHIISSQGTPFAYFLLNNHINSFEFSRNLLKSHKVLVMPAEVFEDSHAIRISYGRPEALLKEGLDKVTSQFTEISKYD